MAKVNNMRSAFTSRSGLLRLLGTVLALALMLNLLRQQDWAEISEVVGRLEAWRLLLALGLMMVSRLSVAARWHVLLRSGGVKATWPQSLKITFAGLFATNFLPTTVGGDVARMGGAMQMGFDAAVSAASLVVDRLVGLFGMVFTFPLGFQKLVASGDLGALYATPFVFLAAQDSWWGRVQRKLLSLWQRLLQALKLWMSQPGALFVALLFTLLHMACLFGAMYILLEGMHEPLPYFTVAGLWSLVYVITLLPFTINALGLQELTITYAFNHLGGLSEANSVALALLVRLLFLLPSLLGVFFLSDVLPGVAKAQPLLDKLEQ
jgi:uncharacterized membrane protein YbhN (UPF0104 family)